MSLAFLRRFAGERAAREPIASISALRARLADLREHSETIEQAALVGFDANGVGWAFAGGYQAALARLDPEIARAGALAALCATEQGGGHPRAIAASLARSPQGGWKLSGHKTWVTLGTDAELLLVVASTGQDPTGRNVLRVARIPARRSGVALQEGKPLPFAPEIAHARAAFESVSVDDGELLPGDGYETVLKPFRTIEDAHVTAAVLGWSIGVARAGGWPLGWIEEALALLVVLRVVGAAPPLAAETHLALAGAQAAIRRLLDGGAWSSASVPVREGWERDHPLLDVASSVRAARLAAAWRTLTAKRE